MTPEKRIQNNIYSYLKSLQSEGKKVYVERRQAGGFSYKMGIADLYAIVNGTHVEIEVKRVGGQLRPMQIKWMEFCKNNNIAYVCATSVDEVKLLVENILTKC